jgi:hypothetical protein
VQGGGSKIRQVEGGDVGPAQHLQLEIPRELKGDMGKITYQGESPFRVISAQPTTARVRRDGVELTVYASVEGQSPDAVQIQVPMSIEDARQLARQLMASAHQAQRERR